MTQFAEAVYTNGVLKPNPGLVLREAQHVRLIVEAIEDDADCGDRHAALRRRLEGIERMEFFSTGPLPSRDELHDRP
jgi:predicted DNA-binding antitoxin AbrB/MazE fold protein